MLSMTLPESFTIRMKSWLGPEWAPFRDAILDLPHVRGVRLQRIAVDAPRSRPGASEANVFTDMPTNLRATAPVNSPVYALASAKPAVPIAIRTELKSPVPWSADGFYIAQDSTLGKTMYHEMGAFYLQEPSAMAVVAALDPQPGENILDLCAAPGGKTTAIGKQMCATGLLVANEIHPSRVVTLAQNLERMGVPAIITNETPQNLASALPQYFDAVLVDAPCSGEGMFRKDIDARTQWSAETPEICAARQREVFAEAVRLVKPGGRMVYSTCTFNPIENEQIVDWALNHFPLKLVSLPHWEGWETGRPDWANDNANLVHTRRLWPHKATGEGHFIAAFQFEGEAETHKSHLQALRQAPALRGIRQAPLPDWESWMESVINGPLPAPWAQPVVHGNSVFSREALDLTSSKLRVLRPGLCLALQHKGRFEPHHSLAMAVAVGRIRNAVELDLADASHYLSGQSLTEAKVNGYVWLHVDSIPLGWGKSVPGRINNMYPKGLRKTGLSALS
jgi:NOL1/NOP2/sun family putative RNA methylase